MWALRHNLSAYDATCVALTEMTAATSLLTTDARLAFGARCRSSNTTFRNPTPRARCGG